MFVPSGLYVASRSTSPQFIECYKGEQRPMTPYLLTQHVEASEIFKIIFQCSYNCMTQNFTIHLKDTGCGGL